MKRDMNKWDVGQISVAAKKPNLFPPGHKLTFILFSHQIQPFKTHNLLFPLKNQRESKWIKVNQGESR